MGGIKLQAMIVYSVLLNSPEFYVWELEETLDFFTNCATYRTFDPTKDLFYFQVRIIVVFMEYLISNVQLLNYEGMGPTKECPGISRVNKLGVCSAYISKFELAREFVI